ncbi:T9SS type A sorting domain-containing protein [Flavobacterium sp.]|uniref:T9SS type A sorting domain-containing protein n=1 Tax=Flavobacterium sp. TaxID=239 RepID=UPI0026192772|nr:T9SS type A sorting domain-containing protein [Flavobacterium sp.]
MKKIVLLLLFLKSTFILSQTVAFDPTFGNNGKTHTGFGISDAKAYVVVTQPDGKIIVGGSAYSANPKNFYATDTNNAVLVRYNSDGTIDPTFGNEGIVTYNYNIIYNSNEINTGVGKLILQPDGKILAVIGGSPTLFLIRFNTNGSIDTSFGNNETHIFILQFGLFVIQPDAKIITASKQDHYNSFGQVDSSYFRTDRYNTDGTLDTTFGTDGTVITDFGFGYNYVTAIALQPDGKVIVAGTSYNNQFAIARYTSSGYLDTTFDGDGKVITSLGSGLKSYTQYVSVQADGKIIVAGLSYPSIPPQEFSFSIAKYNPNGSLDTSFDSDGIVNNTFDDAAGTYINLNTIVEQPDGKFLVTTETGNNFEFVIRRYNASGSDDTSFGNNGKSALFIQDDNKALGIALQQDQKIVVAGTSRSLASIEDVYEFNVVRYSTNGVPDVSFNNDGIIATKFDSSNDLSTKLLIQPNDKIITVGVKKTYPFGTAGKELISISRTHTDGSLDSTFGTDGKVVSDLGQDYSKIKNAVLQPDGKILVSCETATFGNPNEYFLIRYNNNGSLDTTFGNNGKTTLGYVTAILPLPNGKIIIASEVYDAQNNLFLNLKSLNNDGSLDSTFENDLLVNINGTPASIYSTLQLDGKIVVVTSIPNQDGKVGFYKMRYHSDGTIDSSYANGLNVFEYSCAANGIFLRSDGKIYVTGKSNGYDPINQVYSSQFLVACFDANGNLDSNYSADGVATSLMGNVYNIIQSVAMQADGKFIVALTKPEQNPANPTPETYNVVVTRFNFEGGHDADFGTNGVIETSFFDGYDEAFDVALQSDNKIVLACTTDTGMNRDFGLMRFTNNILSNENFTIDTSFNTILYPNPTQNTLNIKFPENVEANKIAIMDSLGQIIIAQNNKSNSNDNGIKSIDVTYLQKGIYIVLLQTNHGVWNGKFVKE